jgi:serine/threonine protein phosphatase PrpC
MKIKGYAASVVGSRSMNQDSYLVDDTLRLYAVADGVGGGLKGEVASKMAVDTVLAKGPTAVSLKAVFEEAQIAVLKEAMDSLGEALMGTTLTAFALKEGFGQLCHVGDSRCYLYNGSFLKLLTEDQEFFDESLQSTVLASYLGIPTDLHPIQIVEETIPLEVGNRILLCSDGLYRQLTEPRIVALINEHDANPQELVTKLCSEASHQEQSDNVTEVYITLDP